MKVTTPIFTTITILSFRQLKFIIRMYLSSSTPSIFPINMNICGAILCAYSQCSCDFLEVGVLYPLCLLISDTGCFFSMSPTKIITNGTIKFKNNK